MSEPIALDELQEHHTQNGYDAIALKRSNSPDWPHPFLWVRSASGGNPHSEFVEAKKILVIRHDDREEAVQRVRDVGFASEGFYPDPESN